MASNILAGFIASNVSDSTGLESDLIARAVELTAKLEAAIIGKREAVMGPPPARKVRVQVGNSVVYADPSTEDGRNTIKTGKLLPDRVGYGSSVTCILFFGRSSLITGD